MADKKNEKSNQATIINRKAHHEYEIGETFDAGIELVGTEVKSIRQGKATLSQAYCRVLGGEVFIYGMHVTPYEQGNRWNVDPLRTRKLLLHASEIGKIQRAVEEKGLSIVPIRLYFSRGYAKIHIGIGRGKKLYDKRDSIAARDVERQKQREVAGRE